MAEQPNQRRSLSEISHLFLSSVRERQTGPAQRPQRKPPQPKSPPAVALQQPAPAAAPVPEALVDTESSAPASMPARPVRALLLANSSDSWLDTARGYAKTVAAGGKRVGLIAIDAAEFHLVTFEPGQDEASPCEPTQCFDGRAVRDAINELNWDVDQWLLTIANIRVPEARALLRRVDHWTTLTGCSHESVISCYRLLKSLAEDPRPKLSLAFESTSPADREQVARRLSSVCQQFLNWAVEIEPAGNGAASVSECQVQSCCWAHDKAQVAAAPHWAVITEFIEQAKHAAAEAALAPTPHESTALNEPAPPAAASTPDSGESTGACVMANQPEAAPDIPHVLQTAAPTPGFSDVIDLPDSADEASVLSAVLRHGAGEIVECPVLPPNCPASRLAVSRDRRLVLIATAGHGLRDLRSIGLAYRWLIENRSLLAMALPQMAIDAHQHPHLRLLVEQSDLNADLLQPILQSNTVQVQTYRRLRWGERNGLLLEAA